MVFAWLKQYLPRSLYGRAALILVVPILTLQLVVSVTFLQRLFEDVTRQMVRNVAFEINFMIDEVERAPDRATGLERAQALAGPLAFDVSAERRRQFTDTRLFYDISGITVFRTLHSEVPEIEWIDLASDIKMVRVGVQTSHGPLTLGFDRRRVSATNPHQLLVLMLFTGILMTAIAYIFLRNQLRPIKKLALAAEAFGKGQRLSYAPSGAVEVRVAGNAFMDMRNRIERQIEQRTMMLSGVSHDLRTPLTRLKLGLSMLDGQDVKDLEADVEEMQSLLDAFLEFARGDALDALEDVDPAALGQRVQARAARGGRGVDWVGPAVSEQVPLRPHAVERALDNLVGNALRYGTHCRISMTLSDRMVRFSVEDDGPGIAPEDREEALKPFARLEPGRNQNRGSGMGLGLAIATDIARQHGGSLRLGQSADLGGLQVDLVLPR